jgi:hypothetical protein
LPGASTCRSTTRIATNAQGEYVDEQGNVVGRSTARSRPAEERFLDVPYPDGACRPRGPVLRSRPVHDDSFTLARNADDTNFFASYSNQQIDGVVLDHGGYGRNDVRLNLDHRLSARTCSSVPAASTCAPSGTSCRTRTFFQLIQNAPDVSLLHAGPGRHAVHLPAGPGRGVTVNPLYELVTVTE